MEIFKSLNDKQIEAVKAGDGPVLILAGAGSGKTKTLTHRIAYLISQGVPPESILAVTFTNKAAEEMKTRIKRLVPDIGFRISNLFVGTFHSFGVKVLREEIDKLGYGKNFVIYDEDDISGIAKSILTDLNLSPDQFKPAVLLNIISRAKNEMKDPEEITESSREFFRNKILDFYKNYEKRLKASNAVDFDDLITLPVKIFKKHPEVLEKYQNRYRYILVDEYQDTNQAQYLLINSLAKKHRNIFAIGDPDQAIYGWRWANFRNILNFETDYSDAQVVKLEQNYRSTQNILSAAHEIIKKNAERKEKTLWTENPTGPLIELVETSNERNEAEFIINKAIELQKNSGIDLEKMVVMYRTNSQSRVLEEACLYADLPYRVVGAVKFYQRKEVKDILAYLKIIENEKDEISLKRILGVMGKRGYENFKTDFEEIKKQKNSLPPSGLIKLVIKKSGYYDYLMKKFPGTGPDGELESESRIKNIKELLGLASVYDEIDLVSALGEFLAQAALMQEERKHGDDKKLNLMTLHSAKGLEFDVVFISGLEEGLMPHSRAAHSFEELEEERRLCYVGLTRAKKNLWLSFAKRRTLWGERSETLPSRFIMEIPPHLINFQSLADGYNVENLPDIELE